MAIIDKPSDFINTKLYTGNGGTNAQTGVGFKPDFTWIKERLSSGYNHALFDVVRGATKVLQSNATVAERTLSDSLTVFGSDGFTLGADGDGTYGNTVNQNTKTYCSWNWKAGTSFSNNAGANGASLASAGSINTTTGFSIIKYTGGGSGGATVNHGLGAVPQMIILKRLQDSGYDWVVYHKDKTAGLYLNNANNNNDSSSNNIWFNGAAPTSQVFTIGSDGRQSNSGKDYLAYCFKGVQGYSKFGTYTGNGNANGPFCYLGFKPSFLMVRLTSGSDDWQILDNKRSPINIVGGYLRPNSDGATVNNDVIDFTSNGFKLRTSAGSWNPSGGTFIYMAFAENPFVTSTDNGSIPTTAR